MLSHVEGEFFKTQVEPCASQCFLVVAFPSNDPTQMGGGNVSRGA